MSRVQENLSDVCDPKGHKYLKSYFCFTVHLRNRLKILSVFINRHFLSETKKTELEGARESEYLRDFLQMLLFEKIRIMSGLSLGTCTSNLKSVALTILEQLAFNAQKFMGLPDPGHASFREMFKGPCPNWLWKRACQI